MKQRLRPRAKPMKSLRHGARRSARERWIQGFRSNPVQYMTDRQRIEWERNDEAQPAKIHLITGRNT